MDAFILAVERAWQRPPRLLWLLYPLELLFGAVTAVRRALFRRGVLESRHPGVPVIVVGNISVGGTGKTPVVIELARELAARGLAPAIVSRGYGGSASGVQRVHGTSDVREVGDEALLIARSAGLPVYVGRDRAAAARTAAEEGAGVLVCDDGLQHYRLRRDAEVVTIDADQGFGNGHLLPVGPLREPERRLAEADFVLYRNGPDAATAFRFEAEGFRRLGDGSRVAARDWSQGSRVHALAAIARPSRFFQALRALGLDPVEHAMPDHAGADAAILSRLNDLPLVMTAKDAVKFVEGAHTNAWVLDMRVAFPEGFVDALCRRVHLVDKVV